MLREIHGIGHKIYRLIGFNAQGAGQIFAEKIPALLRKNKSSGGNKRQYAQNPDYKTGCPRGADGDFFSHLIHPHV